MEVWAGLPADVPLRSIEPMARRAESLGFDNTSVTPPAAPAVTLVEVAKLYGPDFMIEIEAIAAA